MTICRLVAMIVCLARPGFAQVGTAVAWTPLNSLPTFGSVADAVADANGRIYVADHTYGRIIVLDRTLKPIGALGRQGSGLGEFRDLRALRALPHNTLAALDEGLHRIYLFAWIGEQMRLTSTITVPFKPFDVCLAPDGSHLVLGQYNGKRLHKIDSLGTIVASAAPIDARLTRMVANFVVPGRIACLPKSPHSLRVIMTSQTVPVFEVFEGDDLPQLRRVRLDSIWPARRIAIRTTAKSATFTAEADGFHAPGRAIPTREGFVVPAGIRGRADRRPDASLSLFSFDFAAAGVRDRGTTDGNVFPVGRAGYLHVRPGETIQLRLIQRLP